MSDVYAFALVCLKVWKIETAYGNRELMTDFRFMNHRFTPANLPSVIGTILRFILILPKAIKLHASHTS